MKIFFFSMACGLVILSMATTNAFADAKSCQAGTDDYCIDIGVTDSAQSKNQKNDLCFVLELNGSDRSATGSIPMQQLPTALFTITKDRASIGKPFAFKLVKAQVVPAGQCDQKQASLKPVTGCDIFEFAVLKGVSRSIVLTSSNNDTGYVCKIQR